MFSALDLVIGSGTDEKCSVIPNLVGENCGRSESDYHKIILK